MCAPHRDKYEAASREPVVREAGGTITSAFPEISEQIQTTTTSMSSVQTTIPGNVPPDFFLM